MVACFRIGAVVLPCTEQLRAKDLRLRIEATGPKLILADERNRAEVAAAAGRARSRGSPTRRSSPPTPAAAVDAGRGRPAASSPSRAARPASRSRSSTPSATGRASASRPSTGSTRGPATSSGARRRAAGRSRRATCSSRRGCAAPPRCCTTPASTPPSASTSLERERVDVLCMAPTEYRVIAKRARAAPLPRPARRSSPRARRSTPRCCARGRRRPACRSATATGRRRPASSPARRSASPCAPARWAARCPA